MALSPGSRHGHGLGWPQWLLPSGPPVGHHGPIGERKDHLHRRAHRQGELTFDPLLPLKRVGSGTKKVEKPGVFDDFGLDLGILRASSPA